ncbi:MAG: transketolase C-terminal domain-containing protein [Solirubrobacterales bacterium]
MEAATSSMASGELVYVGPDELRRIRTLDAPAVDRAAAFADACRLNVLYMVARAGSGHLGTSFSCIDMLAWLHLERLGESERYFSSKGHDAPALYATLIGTGAVEFDLLHRLRRLGGLPGHPDVKAVPQVVTNTGSLGMGVSKAKGFCRADRLAGRSGSVVVMTGDGELQEGQFWESLAQTANEGFGQITVIVDHTKIQSDTWVSEVSDLGDLEAKVAAFGWEVGRCNGNDITAFSEALADLDRAGPEIPKLLLADTVKGHGVTFMEPGDLPRSADALYAFHSGAPTADDYGRAVAELFRRLASRLEACGASAPRLEAVSRPSAPAVADSVGPPQRLVQAYGEALADLGAERQDLVALDADLVLDTGLIGFRERFPDRFVECGIAEQDMVSQAGAMALGGALPVVHSFACFLSTRPNEQIYNNCTEGTRVIYVGSLVGLVPGGPGHSHQSVRDISALAAMPGMILAEPFCEAEVRGLLRWAVEQAAGPVYLRLVSVPWALGFEPPPLDPPAPGQGTVLRVGEAATIVCTGPVMVSQAQAAAERLAGRGMDVGIIAVPWLTGLDGRWLADHAAQTVVTLDNHYVTGGQGTAVLEALASVPEARERQVVRLGVRRVPVCGTNDEVLREHGLDGDAIATEIDALLRR